MNRNVEGALSCPYCGKPLNWVPLRWFGRGCFVCETCGDFPDLADKDAGARRAVADPAQAARTIPARRDDRPRVMLVDDSVEHRDLYALMLEPTVTVITASRGEEALAIAAKEPLDAIVLDVLMPGMDGWMVCQRLKASPLTAAIPVIMLTSLEGPDVAARAENVGAAAVLSKPCPVERLAFAIETALRRRQGDLSAPVNPSRPLPITITRTRRWTRKTVAASLPARLETEPAHLLNVSYGGVCVELERPVAEIPPSFAMFFPASDVSIQATIVWMARGPSDNWMCGAEVATVTGQWRNLVDAVA